MKHARIWYDGGMARFVERDERGATGRCSAYSPRSCINAPATSGSTARRESKRVLRLRHAIEPRRDLHEAAKEAFIALVAEEIEAEHGRDQFDRLVLVAPPGVLTELKTISASRLPSWWSAICKRT